MGQILLPELLYMAIEENAVPEGRSLFILPTDIIEASDRADLKY
jgi:hypothetical protein